MSIDLAKIKARLEHKQAELQAHIHELRGEQDEAVQLHSVGEEPQDLEEAAADQPMIQAERSILGNEIRLLIEVQHALKQIAEGSYGFCTMCGQPIPEERLKALPWASLCIKDQQRIEQKLSSYS